MGVAEKSITGNLVADPDFHNGFKGLLAEHSGWVSKIRGKIPTDLTGTFFRNGPGTMERGGRQYGHWFDGPGMLNAVTFKDGKAHYKNRYVRTPKYIKENAADKILCRGVGTQREGGFLNNFGHMPTNPANTNVFWHAGKLHAAYEGGQPYKINPETLETIGLDFFDGDLKPTQFMSAHGKINYHTQHFINFGVNVTGVGLKGFKYELEVYNINPAGKIGSTCKVPLDEFPFLHDFGMTENYAIFLISSASMTFLKPLLGLCSMMDTMRLNHLQPVQGIVVDLRTMRVAKQFELPPALIVHFGNSFEQGDDLVTDFMSDTSIHNLTQLADMPHMDCIKGAPFHRYRINTKTWKVSHETYAGVPTGEFPMWDTRDTGYETKHTYYVAPVDDAIFNAVVKVDMETGEGQVRKYGDYCYTSEALFAPRPNAKSDDDGYVISFVYDAKRHGTDIVVLDAKNLDNEIAAVELDHHVPYGFHGHFTPDVFI